MSCDKELAALLVQCGVILVVLQNLCCYSTRLCIVRWSVCGSGLAASLAMAMLSHKSYCRQHILEGGRFVIVTWLHIHEKRPASFASSVH